MAVSYQKLFNLLDERGIGRRELAKMADVSEASLSKMYHQKIVQMDTVDRLCGALHVTYDEIVEPTWQQRERIPR